MTKTYELPNEKMIMADVDEKRHMATVSVYALDDLVKAVNKTGHFDNLLQRLRERISDLYNTDVTYDNGDYNTMDTPTLDKVLEYFDSEVQE